MNEAARALPTADAGAKRALDYESPAAVPLLSTIALATADGDLNRELNHFLFDPPSDPALLVPETAPELDYTFVPDAIKLPEGSKMGAAAAVAFDARGHIYVLSRGAQAFFEFDENGGLKKPETKAFP